MKKEPLKKNSLSLRNRIAKYDNAIQQGFKGLKPTSQMGLNQVSASRQGCEV